MTISSSALTMAQYAMQSNSPMVQAVTFSLIENGALMQDIPFVNRASLIANGVRWEGNLPTVSWANINEEGTTTSGTPTPFQEQVFVIRNNIDVDHLLVEDVNQIVDPRAAQVAAYLKAQTYDFNDKFINNNHVSGNAKAIVGLRARLDNASTYGARSANKIDAAATMTTGATAANFGAFLEQIDYLLWSVGAPEGNGVVLYVNDVLKRRWERLARQFSGQGGFATATDQMGRGITMYINAVVRDPGYKSDQSTRIITATETSAGADGASTYTSVYAAHYGMASLFGWQFAPLDAKDLGLMENGVIYRTFINWAGGLFPVSNRAIGRLYDVNLG